MILPPKLKAGDTVRIIAPSGSYLTSWITEDTKVTAKKRLEALGLQVTFGKHLDEMDAFGSSSIEHRLEDLHDAFTDATVTLILCARGGFNANQLLPLINYDLITLNPKILCGFSDITALSNAIFAKTGLVCYCGPNFSTLGKDPHADFTLDALSRCLMSDAPFDLASSDAWTNTHKGEHPDPVQTMPNAGHVVIHPGQAEGTLLGGNLCTLNLLQGTAYMPDIRGAILFLEDDYESQPHHFDRNLTSLMQQPGFADVQGLIFGRFELQSAFTDDLLRQMIASKRELATLPIIANVDFGHTYPMITFPIGGAVRMEAKATGENRVEIVSH